LLQIYIEDKTLGSDCTHTDTHCRLRSVFSTDGRGCYRSLQIFIIYKPSVQTYSIL